MSKISIKKPLRRWLFGGIGFHNSEATMTPMMSQKFKNERVLKCFREISPTFSRVFAGYADWTREAMDRFADYYDETFRKAGTLIYMVPGRMPIPRDDFDLEDYCERTARNLEYLIKERHCTKLRYFCVTNELSAGNTYAYLANKLELFAKLHDGLYRAFERHGLDISLLATDCSGEDNFPQIEWAANNIDEITGDYCAHLYLQKYQPADKEAYEYCKGHFESLVNVAKKKQKRFILGEYGIKKRGWWLNDYPMKNDVSYGVDCPEEEGLFTLAIAEMSLSVINSGTFAGVYWTLFDYPDPFIREDGDTPEEKAKYDVARFSGHGVNIRYNKNGLVKWCDDEGDYSAYAPLYTMGYMAKFFKKGSRVLEVSGDDELIRAAAVTNADGSVSVCIINRNTEKTTVDIELEHKCDKPLRRYDFSVDMPYENEFCDLQPYSELIECDGRMSIELEPMSVTFLSTDYQNRVPSAVVGVTRRGTRLTWGACDDAEHCYYRVFKDKKQIASTVATELLVDGGAAKYSVISVDKYGNAGEIDL